LIRTTITDQDSTVRTVTGNNNTACFGCHTGTFGKYNGRSIYEQTRHGPGTTVSETTHSDFSQGTLSGAIAVSSGELTLAGNPGLSFDGIDDRVNLGSGYTGTQNSFTFEFWAKPTMTHQIDAQSTSSTAGTAGQKYAIGAQHGGDVALAGVGVSIGTNGVSVYEHTASYMPPLLVYSGNLSNWVHITVVYNNKTPSLYINGQFKKTGLTSPKTPFPSNTFGYGSYGNFGGSLDNIRLWNYARSRTEIQKDMYSELAGNEPGLIGYWKFNEGSGITAGDSAAANNGTVTGAAWNQYSSAGNRISPEFNLPAVTAQGSQIRWNLTTPASTALNIQTDVFLGGAWQGWQAVNNGDIIPGISDGTDLTGAKIRYRANLSTANTSVSPRLQDLNIAVFSNSAVSRSVYPGTGYTPSQCMNCHEPHGKTGISYYRRAEGNTFCTTCHDDSGLPAKSSTYSYQGITAYNNTLHSSATDPGNPGGDSGECGMCHAVHGKDDGTGYSITKQLKYAPDAVCFNGGNGCHADAANSVQNVSIKARFTANANQSAHHSILPEEHSAGGTALQCNNCHNPHVNDATDKIIDPDNRGLIYTPANGITNYIDVAGTVYMMVKAMHDGIPPVVTTGPSVTNMTSTGCLITWYTNEASTTYVDYGPTASYGTTVGNGTLGTYHSVNLTGLTPFQNYHYRIRSTDAVGNEYVSGDRLLDTADPVITTGPSVAGTTPTSTYINWNTNESSTTYVDYNTTVDYAVYGFTYSPGSDTLTTSHSVYLSPLTPGVEYTYRVRSKDVRGRETVSGNSTFRPSGPPSIPTNLAYTDPSPGSDNSTITLSWTASTDPDGHAVRYYVQTSHNNTFTSLINQGFTNYGVTSWQVSVTNQDTVTYYWRVKAVDEYGAESALASSTFNHTGTSSAPSCPILYTWDGERMQFITDLFDSSVGIMIGPGKYRDPRPDGQVVIPGDKLVERNGRYIISFKNERDEVDFHDSVVLKAVDHPVDTEIGLNHFVREQEPYKIYTYGKNIKPVKRAIYVNNPTYNEGDPLPPIDITELVSKVDDRHATGTLFDDNRFTFHLGDLSDAKEIKLVVIGWTEYANAAERIERTEKGKRGIKMDRRLLEILQPDGTWKSEEIRFLPGHSKTSVMDLTGKFPEGTWDYVVRFRGMYRPHFDFVGVDTSPEADLKINELQLVKAKLKYTGQSKSVSFPKPVYDYYSLSGKQLNHTGRFTGYGNVLPLLAKVDDQLVVMDTGDELSVYFKALSPPAPGMTRSFLLIPWNYYKELEYATVDPMPFRGMKMTHFPDYLGEYPEELNHYVEKWNNRVHGPDQDSKPGLFKRIGIFFADLFKSPLEFLLSLSEEPSAGHLKTTGAAAPGSEPLQQTVGLAKGVEFLENHYSLNTNYVMVLVNTLTGSTTYTVASADSQAWQSSTQPSPGSPGTPAAGGQITAAAAQDSSCWTTDLVTGEGDYNYQMYKFKVNESLSNIQTLGFGWVGYGEPTAGHPVTVYIWNFNTLNWESIYSATIGSQKTTGTTKTVDYGPFCNKCHDNAPPAGVLMGSTRNISSTYTGDYHGGAAGTDDSGSTLKAPYTRGNLSMSCVDCHNVHGSQNAYHLREDVNGKAGLSVPSMDITGPTDTSKNASILTYCQSCHAGTLDNFHMAKCLSCHRDPGTHDCSPPTAADFSRACTYCHFHGGTMPAHGRFDGDCHCGTHTAAKAF